MPSDSDAAAAATNGAAAPPPSTTEAADPAPAHGAAPAAAPTPKAAPAEGEADGAPTAPAADAPPDAPTPDPETEAKAKAEAEAAAAARAADDAALAAGARVRATRAALAHAFSRPATTPPRPPDHWDYVLAEAAWMKADFDGERAWKQAAAAACARAAARVDWPTTLKPVDTGREYRDAAAAFRAADDGAGARDAPPPSSKDGLTGTRSSAPAPPTTPPRLTYTLPRSAPAALAAALDADALQRRVAHLISVRQYEDDLAAARRAAAAAAAAARAAAEAEADALRAASARARALGRRASLAGTDSGRLSDSDAARGGGARRDRKRGRADDDALSLAPRPSARASGARAPDPRRAGGARAARGGRPGPAGRPATGPAALGAPWTPADDVLLCAVVHEFGSNWALVGDVLTGSAGLRGAVRGGGACRARFRALTHPGDPASLEAGVSEEGVAAAASITKTAARDLLARALPVPDTALGAAARAAGAAFASARARRAAEESRARDVAAARGGTAHASHAAVAATALAPRGGVPPQPSDLLDAAEAAAARGAATHAAAPAGPAAAAGPAALAGGGAHHPAPVGGAATAAGAPPRPPHSHGSPSPRDYAHGAPARRARADGPAAGRADPARARGAGGRRGGRRGHAGVIFCWGG